LSAGGAERAEVTRPNGSMPGTSSMAR
jgi:hypothetical protein